MPMLRSKLAAATASSTVATEMPKSSSVAWATSSTPSSDDPSDSLQDKKPRMLIGRMLTTRNATRSRTAIRLRRGELGSASARLGCLHRYKLYTVPALDDLRETRSPAFSRRGVAVGRRSGAQDGRKLRLSAGGRGDLRA